MTCENKPIDVGLVIDAYAGFTDDVFTGLKNFVAELVSKFTISADHTHFSIITFGGRAVEHFYFNSRDFYNSRKLQEKIKSLQREPGPGHGTDDAISLADSLFKESAGHRPKLPAVLVVFTADKTNSQSTPYPAVLEPLIVSAIVKPYLFDNGISCFIL